MQSEIHADVIGSRGLEKPETLAPTLEHAVAELNALFAPALAMPFAVVETDAVRGALADAVQAPLCVSVLRELVAPLQVRVGVAADGAAEEAFVAAWHADRLVLYRGVDVAGDLLLNAYCAMVEPLVRARTAAEWDAIRTARRHPTPVAAAAELGIGVDELERRLRSGHWREVEDADATVAAYLALVLGAKS
ncbi:MAG TPA: hypothetical protein VL117_00790 [Thermoleophilia bacterium]|nr:hypothetical protein [Thermoleophilia bacterium]